MIMIFYIFDFFCVCFALGVFLKTFFPHDDIIYCISAYSVLVVTFCSITNRSLHPLVYSSWPVDKTWPVSDSTFHVRAEVNSFSV